MCGIKQPLRILQIRFHKKYIGAFWAGTFRQRQSSLEAVKVQDDAGLRDFPRRQ